MNGIGRYNIKTLGAAIVTLILLLFLFSYLSAPQSATFLESINPLSALAGILFTLCYIGIPMALSVVVLTVMLFIIFMILFIAARRIIK